MVYIFSSFELKPDTQTEFVQVLDLYYITLQKEIRTRRVPRYIMNMTKESLLQNVDTLKTARSSRAPD